MKLEKFHKDFQLNNTSFSSVDELLKYSHSLSEEINHFFKNWFSKEDFILVKTSGSTGIPKEIKLQKEQMKNSAFATGKYFGLKEKTTALLCLSTVYIAGKMMLVRALTLGWHLDVLAVNSFPLREIKKEYDFSAMVPLQLQNSIENIHLIQTLIVGGGVVSNQLKNKLQIISTDVFATYGMTETITHIAVKKLNNFKNVTTSAVQKSYYETIPNVEIYKDVRNCLVIKAPRVSNEIIFTNDIVNLISDTKFEWLGRFDNVINSGGIKLHPEKIEEELSKIITTLFFVAGIPDEKLGERLVLVLELQNHKVSKFESLLLENIKNLTSLSKFEKPKEIYFVDEFVQTETGKIQRKKTLHKIFN